MRRIATFPEAISLGGNAFINYSDAAERPMIHPGLGSYLATRFQQPIPALNAPSFHSDHIYRWANVMRDLLWTNPAARAAPITDGPFYLPDLGWVVDRRSFEGATLAYVGAEE